MQGRGATALFFGGLRAGQQLPALLPAAGGLLAALRGALGAAGSAPAAAGSTAAAAAGSWRSLSQDAGAAHPHHHYADTHRPWDEGTHFPPKEKRPSALASAAAAAAAPAGQPTLAAASRYARRPEGPPSQVLLNLASRHGVADGQAFETAVLKLTAERQHGLLEHAQGVARHLQALGLERDTVGRMLQHCPALFSFPAEERAEVLLGELMGERCGRTAQQAAELFVRCPALANTRHVMPSIVRLVVQNHSD